jgi:hypothetical protein
MTSKLMLWAQGHDAGCQLKFTGCHFGPTMGCHLPSGVAFGKGTAYKPSDFLISLGCAHCHDILDSRRSGTRGLNIIDKMRHWEAGHKFTLVLAEKDGAIRYD